jgi:hypothetical protein
VQPLLIADAVQLQCKPLVVAAMVEQLLLQQLNQWVNQWKFKVNLLAK